MKIGMCTCGNLMCQWCGPGWAPTVFGFEEQRRQTEFWARRMKPRWKRHADGSWTQLPNSELLFMTSRL